MNPEQPAKLRVVPISSSSSSILSVANWTHKYLSCFCLSVVFLEIHVKVLYAVENILIIFVLFIEQSVRLIV